MCEAADDWVLQVSPNDHPPFLDLARAYEQACASLGLKVQTLFLAAPLAEPLEGAIYLNLTSAKDTGRAVRALEEGINGARFDSSPLLAICHRYRAYRVLRGSRVAPGRVVTVAHEFGFFKRLSRRVERALFARRVQFAGVSPAVQVELAQSANEALCLPNAIDLSELDAGRLTREAALEVLDIPAAGFTIGIVGRLVDKKHPQLAVDALAALGSEIPDARLLVIGSGELEAELIEQATGLEVTFCGWVPQARRVLSALDVLLLTSREVEAFGMAALEAMASGVAVASGPLPGPQSVLGSCGYYYLERSPEAIAEVLIEVHEDHRTGAVEARLKQGRERAEREFSIAALAARLDDLFF